MRNTFILLALIILTVQVNAQLRDRSLRVGGETAVKSFTDTNSVEPKDFVSLNRLGVETGLERGDYSAARVYFEKALTANHECFVCRYNLGRALIKLDKYPEAIEQFEKLVEEQPGFADGYASIGEVYSLAERHEVSTRYYKRALELAPDDAITLNNYASSLDRLGYFDEALKLFRKAIRIRPDMVEAHCSLGVTLYKVGKKSEAYERLKLAHEINPKDAETLNNLGVVVDDLDKNKQAFNYFKEAVRLKPTFANAVYNLGLMHIERGERGEATEQLKALEKLDEVLANELRKHLWSKWVLDANEVGSK
ncbi:MAG TPA: tetratricopeptide repeat protein [Aridibacter sp.]|nr:tetratricopeptide repeat protein [Aridibacter sp.]